MLSLAVQCILLLLGLGIQLSYGGDIQSSSREPIFTHDQAGRGENIFNKSCASCHGVDLAGVANAPSLAGDSFLQRWQGHAVGELFERIRMTMPKGQPHSLDDSRYADIIAFILEANGYTPGKSELMPDRSVLDQTTMGQP